MLPENQPAAVYSVVVVKRGRTQEATVRLRVLMSTGEEATLHTWEWPSGRPTAAMLADLTSTLVDELTADVVTRWGIQGDLLG